MSIKFGTTILFFLCVNLQRLAVGYECHREGQFVKVEPDGLPQLNPIKVTTTTEGTFCSIKCLDYPGCNSFAYLNYTSSENCLLSSSVDGASVSGASGVVEIYKKAVVEVPKGCDPNPCLNGGTCLDTCKEPFYHCVCPEETTGHNCTAILYGLYGSEILNQQNYIVQLETWLGDVKSWNLCYRATDNGWTASTFHSLCDSKKPTVTIIRSGSYIFGAYSDVAFGNSSSSYKSSSNAFIFSFVNKDNLPPFKSPVKINQYALYTRPIYGPTFGGGHDIHIANNSNANTGSYTNFDHSYKAPTGYSYTSTEAKNLLAGTYRFTPNEVETFYFN